MNRMIKYVVAMKTIPQGAATTVWACVAPRVSTESMRGAFLADCGPIPPNEEGQDKDGILRDKLWQVTESQINEALKTAK